MNDTTLSQEEKFAKLKLWQIKSAATKAAIAEERALRSEIVDLFNDAKDFPPETYSGVESVDIGEGFDLKIEHKLDYKLDTGKANDCIKLAAILERITNSVEGGSIIVDRLINWKPEISVREYKLLTPSHKAMIDEVLTIKPASKSLEIKKRGG